MNTRKQPMGTASANSPSILNIIRGAVSTGLQVHSYNDASELLGISKSTVRNMVKSGQLHQVKIGKTMKITHASIEELFNGRA